MINDPTFVAAARYLYLREQRAVRRDKRFLFWMTTLAMFSLGWACMVGAGSPSPVAVLSTVAFASWVCIETAKDYDRILPDIRRSQARMAVALAVMGGEVP